MVGTALSWMFLLSVFVREGGVKTSERIHFYLKAGIALLHAG